ncbi:MAG: 50S ribosomal protein L21 [Pseudomonadota bacterium]
MFAVIKTGGKQYKVAKDDEITIEKLTAEPGEAVRFDEVLMLGKGEGDITVGQPLITDAAVQGEVLDQIRGEKVYTFHKRRRKHSSKRLKGHRQSLTVVKITEIVASGASAPAKKAKKAEPKPEEAAAVEGAKPSNLLDAAQGEADDLTKISGVGPGLSKKLNDNGVFHFWQIAEWGPSEVAFMDDQLSFKGRIDRDNWIEQAKGLAEEAKND